MGVKRLHDTEAEVVALKLQIWIKHQMSKQNLSMRRVSLRMGKSENYLYAKMKRGDFMGAELVHLGNMFQANPFDMYRPLLNLFSRETREEKKLAEKVAELEKERDLLKEILMGRK